MEFSLRPRRGEEVAPGLSSQCKAVSAEVANHTASSVVEVDVAYLAVTFALRTARETGSTVARPCNQTSKCSVVVVACERSGRTLCCMSKTEDACVSAIAARIALGFMVHADEAAGWDRLHARFLTKRINHTESYSDSDGEACTNQAKSFLRLRLAKMGIHHRITGVYLGAYAGEMA